MQYHVNIIDACQERTSEPDRKDRKLTGQIIPIPKKARDGTTKKLDLSESRPLSRRVLDTLKREKDLIFASDGGQVAYAPMRLFTETDVNAPEIQEVPTTNGESGKYGPADDKGQNKENVQSGSGIFKFYSVKVKKDCEENDADSEK